MYLEWSILMKCRFSLVQMKTLGSMWWRFKFAQIKAAESFLALVVQSLNQTRLRTRNVNAILFCMNLPYNAFRPINDPGSCEINILTDAMICNSSIHSSLSWWAFQVQVSLLSCLYAVFHWIPWKNSCLNCSNRFVVSFTV